MRSTEYPKCGLYAFCAEPIEAAWNHYRLGELGGWSQYHDATFDSSGLGDGLLLGDERYSTDTYGEALGDGGSWQDSQWSADYPITGALAFHFPALRELD